MATKPRKRKKARAPGAPNEHQIQSAFFDWVHTLYPGDKLIHAVPNAAKRGPALASYMKAEGLTKGVLDVACEHARGKYHGMRIEFKVPGNDPTDDQEIYIAQATRAGLLVRVHTDTLQAIAELKAYMAGKHEIFETVPT